MFESTESKAAPSQVYDEEGFVNLAFPGSRGSKYGPQASLRIVNPRILLLDFVDGFEHPFKALKDILDNKTQIRGYSLRKLDRGGISIWFRRPGQKVFAEGLIKEQLANKLAKKSWTQKKRLFEVVIHGTPRSFNTQRLS